MDDAKKPYSGHAKDALEELGSNFHKGTYDPQTVTDHHHRRGSTAAAPEITADETFHTGDAADDDGMDPAVIANTNLPRYDNGLEDDRNTRCDNEVPPADPSLDVASTTAVSSN